MNEEKGYVIRCHDLHDGTTDYRGIKGIIAKTKAGLTVGDTYTLSGAKRALSNMRRLCFEPDTNQYSIERLDEFYFSLSNDDNSGPDSSRMKSSIDHAMVRLDELWNGNDFDNGDKMRINEVRRVFRMLKEAIDDGGKGQCERCQRRKKHLIIMTLVMDGSCFM